MACSKVLLYVIVHCTSTETVWALHNNRKIVADEFYMKTGKDNSEVSWQLRWTFISYTVITYAIQI